MLKRLPVNEKGTRTVCSKIENLNIMEKRTVPLLDLKEQYATIKSEIREAIDRVLESQAFILGSEVSEFEESVRQYLGCEYAIGVSSGTDALLLSLMALEIGPGDEVVTTPYTFFATAGSIARTGAKIVFVDIEEDSFNIDPAKLSEAITDRTKAIVPVHLYGRSANMDGVMEAARAAGIPVIEDSAQSIGARCGDRLVGTIGDLGCFSFFPAKNLGGYGDGGLVATNDEGLAEACRKLRVHGGERRYYHESVGGNFRLDALQAAILRVKLPYLDGWNAARRANAIRYRELLTSLAEAGQITLPLVGEGDVSNQFCIRIEERDRLQAHLSERGISTAIYYPLSLHQQQCFADLGYGEGDFPISERCANTSLALPVYPEVGEDAIGYVVDSIGEFFK